MLKSYNGNSISYDAIGNPLNDGTWTYTWQEGRKLATMSDGSTTWTYTYDGNGMRTSRTSGSVTYNYTYNGSLLTHMSYVTSYETKDLHFYYDTTGRPLSFTFEGETYYYVLNLQGDVVAILDSSAEMVVGYIYDAWGRLIKTTDGSDPVLVSYNPLCYRGYAYDRETELYYLQSRYYNPEIGRFINADNQIAGVGGEVSGYNLFAYCGNNPVNRIDTTGEAWWHWALGAAVVATCAIATIVTCGGFIGAATAVCLVSSGIAASTTAATVSAGAFICSSAYLGIALLDAANSGSIQEFNSKGDWETVIGTTGSAFWGGCAGYSISNRQPSNKVANSSQKAAPHHTKGFGNPNKNVNPGGSYTKIDSKGNIYSYSQFDDRGRETMRIDFQGRPHAGVIPHIHLYKYMEQGGRQKYVFDLNWHLID